MWTKDKNKGEGGDEIYADADADELRSLWAASEWYAQHMCANKKGRRWGKMEKDKCNWYTWMIRKMDVILYVLMIKEQKEKCMYTKGMKEKKVEKSEGNIRMKKKSRNEGSPWTATIEDDEWGNCGVKKNNDWKIAKK